MSIDLAISPVNEFRNCFESNLFRWNLKETLLIGNSRKSQKISDRPKLSALAEMFRDGEYWESGREISRTDRWLSVMVALDGPEPVRSNSARRGPLRRDVTGQAGTPPGDAGA